MKVGPRRLAAPPDAGGHGALGERAPARARGARRRRGRAALLGRRGPADGCGPRRRLVPGAAAARRARAGVDVLHCTIFRAPPAARVPTILTVHDLAVLRHPEVFPAWTRLYGRTMLPRTIRGVDRVFAVSEFSKRETAELAGVDLDRIDVVPNAVEPGFCAEGERAAGEYVLAVGTLEPRKNLARVVEATARVGVELRLVGAPGWGDAGGRRTPSPGSAGSATTSWRPPTAARAVSPSRRSTRASASPRSRQWPAARRS